MIRVCCACRREIRGDGKECVAFGPKLLPHENETSGFCFKCFIRLYGDLDVGADEPPKEERRV